MRRSYTAQRILIYFGGVGLLGSYNLSPQNPYRTFSHNAVHVLPASVHDRHAAQTRYLSAQLHQQRTRRLLRRTEMLAGSGSGHAQDAHYGMQRAARDTRDLRSVLTLRTPAPQSIR